MTTPTPKFRAIDAPNQYADLGDRRLAYRSIGDPAAKPIVLCVRFRGNLDMWDPAFLDALAGHGLRVITFDYAGWGLSSGERQLNPALLARDAASLIEALDLHDAVIAGWSLGGMVAQIVAATQPQRLSHAVLIATAAPDVAVKPGEALFNETAAIPGSSVDKDTILFFEPASAASRAAAAASYARVWERCEGRSPDIDAAWAAGILGPTPRVPAFPAPQVLQALKHTTLPILHIGGDHDIAFPVENWHALSGQLPTLQLLTFPQAGHGPHHQYPEAAAGYIATFIQTSSR
nr:alpha/beta hydrolase [uncultured Massilia sp.]